MESIKFKSKVGADGVLTVQVPTGIQNAELEVLVIIQPIQQAVEPEPSEALGWPPGFFEQFYGSFHDALLERPEQGTYEIREELV
jgi:hypothetical protein